MLKVQLKANLRREILRGHPWVYRQAIAVLPREQKACLCKVMDAKQNFLCWAYYDPHSPIALRVLSLADVPPTNWEDQFAAALELRKSIISGPDTNAYRLFNGEGDLLPGLICDIYESVAVVQFDGQGAAEFWDRQRIGAWLIAVVGVKSVVDKSRTNEGRKVELVSGSQLDSEVTILENKFLFKVNIIKGQKTGFFLDQRDNRNYLGSQAQGKTVLNLFSYSGGFSICAGVGGAKEVTSVDVSAGAMDLARSNWSINGLAAQAHIGVCQDVFEFLAKTDKKWDMIVVDPPSMAHSEDQKKRAIAKYIDLFHRAGQRLAAKGDLVLSSCSSHITFNDFDSIICEALSKGRKKGRILRVSGQGADHPSPHICNELRYLKFVHLQVD